MTYLEARRKREFDKSKGIMRDTPLTPIYIIVTVTLALIVGYGFMGAVQEKREAKSIYLSTVAE